jgi:hypothetical protein
MQPPAGLATEISSGETAWLTPVQSGERRKTASFQDEAYSLKWFEKVQKYRLTLFKSVVSLK